MTNFDMVVSALEGAFTSYAAEINYNENSVTLEFDYPESFSLTIESKADGYWWCISFDDITQCGEATTLTQLVKTLEYVV